MTRGFRLVFVALAGVLLPAATGAEVQVVRVPHRGEVPEVVVDAKGVWHMTYGRGLPGNGYYVQARDQGKTFTRPVRLNRNADTVTTGMERGPKLALGTNGVIHVVWMGYYRNTGGVWYTRSTDGGKTFARERNLISPQYGVDNATVTAAGDGNVWAFWTGGFPGTKQEEDSPTAAPIVMVHSTDNGKTFSKNALVRSNHPASGRACGCCRLNAEAVGDKVYLAFRGGYKNLRDPYFLAGNKGDNLFKCARVSADNWEFGCPMQGIPFHVDGRGRVLLSWMSRDRAYWSLSTDGGKSFGPKVGTANGGKQTEAYPVAVANKKGEVLFVWKEEGQVVWAQYTRDGKPTKMRGQAGRVPNGNKPTVVVCPDGNFAILF